MSSSAADGGGVLEPGVVADGGGVTEPLDHAQVAAQPDRFSAVLDRRGGRTQQCADRVDGQAGRGAQVLDVLFELFGVWWSSGVGEMVWEADSVC
jgi:hypothetical protein